MEMMEVDEPLSSLEAQRAPALDTEEGLLIPVAGPETPFRPTSGMPGLTPTGGTCDSAAVRRGAGAQRTFLRVRRAAGMLRACYRHAANALTVMLQML